MARALIAILVLLFCAPADAHAQSPAPGLRSFSISYSIHARGLNVGAADYAFTFHGDTYEGRSTRRATGLAHMLLGASQDFTYSARGRTDATGRVRPVSYQHQGGRNRRLVQVSFDADAITTIATPRMGMGHPPATEAQKAGSIDQVSMFVQMLTAAGDPCRQTLKVYMDGRSRFDLVLAPNGRQAVSLGGFRGEAYRCAVHFAPIAGFSDPQAQADMMFLFAPVRGYFIPVQIEMPTDDAGLVVLQATRFAIDGAR